MVRECVSMACEPCKYRRSKCDGVRPSCGTCLKIFNKSSDQHCTYNLDGDMRTKGALRKLIAELREVTELQQELNRALMKKFAPDMDPGGSLTIEDLRRIIAQLGMVQGNDAAPFGFPNGELPSSSYSLFGAIQQQNRAGFEAIGSSLPETGAQQTQTDLPFESLISPLSSMGSIGFQNFKVDPGTSFSLTEPFFGHENIASASLPDQGLNFGLLTEVTNDQNLILELLHLYFRWVHPFYTLFVKHSFYENKRLTGNHNCTPFLFNAIMATGSNYLSRSDKAALGMLFSSEARRQYKLELQSSPQQTQALGVLSIYSMMNGEIPRGWKYQLLMMSGVLDLNLHVPYETTHQGQVDFDNVNKQAHEVTMWGCYNLHMAWCAMLARPLTVSKSIIQTPFPTPTQNTEFMLWEGSNLAGHQHTIIGALSALSLITESCVKHLKVIASGFPVPPATLELQYQELQRWFGELSDLLKKFIPGLPSLPHTLTLHIYYYTCVIRLMYPLFHSASPEPAVERCTHAARSIFQLIKAYQMQWCSNGIASDPKNAYTPTMAYCVMVAAEVSISNLVMHQNGPEAATRLNHHIRTLFSMVNTLPVANQYLARLKATIIMRNYPNRGWTILDQAVSMLLTHGQSKNKAASQQLIHQAASQSLHQPVPQRSILPNNLDSGWVVQDDAVNQSLTGKFTIDPNLISSQDMTALYQQPVSNIGIQNSVDYLLQFDVHTDYSTQQTGLTSTLEQNGMLDPTFDDPAKFGNQNDNSQLDFEQTFCLQQERQNYGEDEGKGDFFQ